jgi:cell division protein FtsB
VTPPEAPARTDSFRLVLGATVLLALALLAIAGLKSWRDLEAARAHERLLAAQITGARAESERLRQRIERLRHDPGMLERLAREDLGMVRPGDVIIELPGPDPHPPGPLSRPLPSPRAGGLRSDGFIPSGVPPAAMIRAGLPSLPLGEKGSGRERAAGGPPAPESP